MGRLVVIINDSIYQRSIVQNTSLILLFLVVMGMSRAYWNFGVLATERLRLFGTGLPAYMLIVTIAHHFALVRLLDANVPVLSKKRVTCFIYM